MWLARQREPLVRTVAFKILKPSMEGRQVIARFDAERQALARMDHPWIAKILDAGTTPEDGRPYFVMEFVDGESVTEYCDQRTLEVSDRLEIFEKICLAVHHAHQKGVIHRDLKPTNVLVSEHDEVPTPKVIDFGIAKALERPLTDQTIKTEILQILGTPALHEPGAGARRLRGRRHAHGHLLAGRLALRALDRDDALRRLPLEPRPPVEIQRAIREEEVQRPSARVREPGDRRDGLAQRRRSDPNELSKTLRGDLDRIALMAMEKDPGRALRPPPRRWRATSGATSGTSPSSRAARAPGYLLWKFVLRHQVAATSVISVATALLIGFVMAMLGLKEASEQRDQLQEGMFDLYVTQAPRVAVGNAAGPGGARLSKRSRAQRRSASRTSYATRRSPASR